MEACNAIIETSLLSSILVAITYDKQNAIIKWGGVVVAAAAIVACISINCAGG